MLTRAENYANVVEAYSAHPNPIEAKVERLESSRKTSIEQDNSVKVP